jgi:acyl-CoA hydrolase
VIYSVVPPELGEEVYARLVERYKDNPNITVIMDRRKADRRKDSSGGGERETPRPPAPPSAGLVRRLSRAAQTPRPPRDGGTRASATPVELSSLMLPADANFMGVIHGGIILKLIDEAAGTCAYRFARTRVVTASIDRTSFPYPVQIGNLVVFKASVNWAGHSSMEIGVRVEAEDLNTGTWLHTNSAYLVYVALGDDGRPTPCRRSSSRPRSSGVAGRPPNERRRVRLERARARAPRARPHA